jgi:hypothetical protein
MSARDWMARLIGAMPRARERQPADEAADAPGVVIDPETFALVQTLLERELRSRDTLRSGLVGLLAFSGAMLALSVAAEASVLQHGLGSIGQPMFFVVLAATQLLLLTTAIRAVKSLDSRPRGRLSAQLLVDLGYEPRAPDEIRGLAYRVGATNLRDLVGSNDELGEQTRAVVKALRAALVAAAAAGFIIAGRGIGLWTTHRTHLNPATPRAAVSPKRAATVTGAPALARTPTALGGAAP